MTLFEHGGFRLHSGQSTDWRINCEALADDDLDTLAMLAESLIGSWSKVEGVPTGGLRFAAALQRRAIRCETLLIADDVLTTGASMEQQRAGRAAKGVVIFARGPCPSWVTPLWSLSGANHDGPGRKEVAAEIYDRADRINARCADDHPKPVRLEQAWALETADKMREAAALLDPEGT